MVAAQPRWAATAVEARNALSFRHTEAALLRLVRESGYAKVMQMRPAHRRNYTFYFCLPQPARTARRMVSRPQRPQAGGTSRTGS